jgi:uncharacterized protein (TIGR00730 family)
MAAQNEISSRVVSVFGGSRAAEDSADYALAYRLGRLLGERGYAVCNGGYHGTMAAAARGAKDANGRTIGVTIEALAYLPPNPWIDEEVSTVSLFARLEQLVTLADAYVVLPGGIGTLLELAVVWNLLELKSFPFRPLIALGDGWRRVLRALPRHLAVRPVDLALITLADTPEAAVEHLARYFVGEAPPSPSARLARATGEKGEPTATG